MDIFTPRVPGWTAWTFLAFGDTQVGTPGAEDLIDARSRNPSAPLLLHAGDVVNKPSS